MSGSSIHYGTAFLSGARAILGGPFYKSAFMKKCQEIARKKEINPLQYQFRCPLTPTEEAIRENHRKPNFTFPPVENPAAFIAAIAQERPLVIDTIGGSFLQRYVLPEAIILEYTDDFTEIGKQKGLFSAITASAISVKPAYDNPSLIQDPAKCLAETLWSAITTEDGLLKENAGRIFENITLLGYCRHTVTLDQAFKALKIKADAYFAQHPEPGKEAPDSAQALLSHLRTLNLSPIANPKMEPASGYLHQDYLVDRDYFRIAQSQHRYAHRRYMKENPQFQLQAETSLSSEEMGLAILKATGMQPPKTVKIAGRKVPLDFGYHSAAYYLHCIERDHPNVFADFKSRTYSGLSQAETRELTYQTLCEIQPAAMKAFEEKCQQSETAKAR